MIDRLNNELRFQQQALDLLSQRQEILASNIANADTPGYLARDMDFSAQLNKAVEQGQEADRAFTLTRTSENHISASSEPATGGASDVLYRIPDQSSADGNTVDMDRERVNFADNNVKYQSSLTFITAQIKNMMAVINQG